MITLDDVLTKLQLTTSGTAAVDVSVQFVDETHEGTRSVAASQETAITTATTTDVLAVPATSNRRIVQQITVSNKGGAANTVTLVKDVNGTDYRIGGAVALAAGEWLVVAGTGEFQVFEADGTLKVAGGGGGGGGDALTTDPLSQFAATTSAQLAGVLSDETGTGAAVFANSPALVTPDLGTPSAVVLTNATGLPTAGLVDDAVTYVKVQDVSATDRVLGRATAGAGVIEEITCTAAGRALLDDADAAAQRTTLGMATVSQAEAEAGTATTERAWTAERVAQAIAALESGGSGWTLTLKTADESRASTTTLVDDSSLVLSLAANTKYLIRCKVFTTIANATMDFKFGTAYSGTTTGNIYTNWRMIAGGAATGTAAEGQGVSNALIASQAVTATTAGVGHLLIEQSIETTNAGTWSFQWAQNTSDASNATVGRGSYIEYMVVA